MIDFTFVSEHCDFTELVVFEPLPLPEANQIVSTSFCPGRLRSELQWFRCSEVRAAMHTSAMQRWGLAEEAFILMRADEPTVGMIGVKKCA